MSKKNEKASCGIKTSIGGQALIEGIMMRGPKRTAMSVRNVQGVIVTEEWDNPAPPRIAKIPLLRGVYSMYSSLKLGYKCLMRSALLSGIEEEEEKAEKEKKLQKLNKKRAKEGLPPLEYLPGDEPKEEPAPETPAEAEKTVETVEAAEETAEAVGSLEEKAEAVVEETAENGAETVEAAVESAEAKAEETVEEVKEAAKEEKGEKKSSTGALIAGAAAIGSVLGVALAIGLFIFLPTQIYTWTIKNAVETGVASTYLQMLLRSLFEGVIRIAVFVGYMLLVSLMKDIKRTFMYHGAEHKTIFCYEAGLPLTVENVRKMRRFHPRCGTSFMIVMLILGILIGSFIPAFHSENLLTELAPKAAEIVNNLLRSLCKLALLPITVGLGYEFIKYAGKHDNLFVKILSAPGLWMQRISTKEPDDSMIECAITAVKKVIPDDGSDRL